MEGCCRGSILWLVLAPDMLAALRIETRGAWGSILNTRRFVEGQNLFQSHPKNTPKVIYPVRVITLPKLSIERQPRNTGGPPWRYPMKSLRQPCVDIEGKRTMRQRRNMGLVKRHGVVHEALEVIKRRAAP